MPPLHHDLGAAIGRSYAGCCWPNKIVVVGLQAARFTEICNVDAPVYRAMTVSGWSAPADKQEAALVLAYLIGLVRRQIASVS
jgi:Protein of unknown function (DUF3089)